MSAGRLYTRSAFWVGVFGSVSAVSGGTGQGGSGTGAGRSTSGESVTPDENRQARSLWRTPPSRIRSAPTSAVAPSQPSSSARSLRTSDTASWSWHSTARNPRESPSARRTARSCSTVIAGSGAAQVAHPGRSGRAGSWTRRGCRLTLIACPRQRARRPVRRSTVFGADAIEAYCSEPAARHDVQRRPRFQAEPLDLRQPVDEKGSHLGGSQVATRQAERDDAGPDQRCPLGGSVADAIVLHEDRPSLLSRTFQPVDVGDGLVGRDAVDLGKRRQLRSCSTQGVR